MSLTIICPFSFKYKENIEKTCKVAGISDYEILDPKTYDLNKPYGGVIILGAPTLPKKFKAKALWYAQLPDAGITTDEKIKILDEFKKAGAWSLLNKDIQPLTAEEIPETQTLKEWLKGKENQIISMDIEANGEKSSLAIYPDGQILTGKFDKEYHASDILNIAQLRDIFNFKSISFKSF
jgi:hypothetical protein